LPWQPGEEGKNGEGKFGREMRKKKRQKKKKGKNKDKEKEK